MKEQKRRPEDYLRIYMNQVSGSEGIRVREFANSKDCVIYQIEGTRKKEFERFAEAIERIGSEVYDFRRIRDNLFYTFLCDGEELHTYYTGHDGTVRIIIDSSTKIYPVKGESGNGEEAAILYQFELDYRRIDCGMCYIIKCKNGSFFIIDSAHMFSEEDHIRLYRFLRKHTGEKEKTVISGWFLSHAHQDHIVKFMDFVKEGFSDVVLEDIYYNFPLLTVEGSQSWKEDDKETMKEFDRFMEAHGELSAIRLHTGQRFCVGGLNFTVLSTHEDLCAYSLECYNNASTVLMMETDGSRVLFLGDADYLACSEMTARYGKHLKADIVQVAHHGFNGSNAGIYYMAEAKTALYPARQKEFDENRSSAANRTVLGLCEEYYIAGNGTVEIKFPCRTGKAVQYSPEINGK